MTAPDESELGRLMCKIRKAMEGRRVMNWKKLYHLHWLKETMNDLLMRYMQSRSREEFSQPDTLPLNQTSPPETSAPNPAITVPSTPQDPTPSAARV